MISHLEDGVYPILDVAARVCGLAYRLNPESERTFPPGFQAAVWQGRFETEDEFMILRHLFDERS